MDLCVTIPAASGDLVFKNPVMPAAATFGNVAEYKDYFDLSLLGAMMPNSLCIDTGTPTKFKKFYKSECGFISALARNNISIYEFNEKVVPQLPWRNTPVIVNTKATDMEEMEKLAAVINEMEGIAAIEVNLNCPYGVPGATPYWKTPGKAGELVRRVKAAAPQKAIIVKSATADTSFALYAMEVQEAGADAFTCFNGVSGKAIDIRTRKFRCGGGGGGGYSGAGLKPVGVNLCCTAKDMLDIPIIAAGGVRSAADVLEYVMAGATVVQVGSANMTRPDIMAEIIRDLPPLMEELGIGSLEEIRGCATVE